MLHRDPTRCLPLEWTEEACDELVAHAIELGHNGNPAGFLVSTHLSPFLHEDEWDYVGIRAWIAANLARVTRVWQWQVRYD